MWKPRARYAGLAAVAGIWCGGLANLSAGPVADDYVTRRIEGWTVHVNRRLLDDKAAVGRPALRLLEVKLYEIVRVVPKAACERLQQVPIWLGVDEGHAPCAEYHPSEGWLKANGYDPGKAKSVEIGNAAKFLEWSKHQPMMVLHELAHAYHHQVLGHDNAPVREAYEAAVKGGSYDAVLHESGQHKRAYALSNLQEYFAELSEAYFGVNDFYPFVRAELKEHDPAGYEAVRQAWSSPPAAVEGSGG